MSFEKNRIRPTIVPFDYSYLIKMTPYVCLLQKRWEIFGEMFCLSTTLSFVPQWWQKRDVHAGKGPSIKMFSRYFDRTATFSSVLSDHPFLRDIENLRPSPTMTKCLLKGNCGFMQWRQSMDRWVSSVLIKELYYFRREVWIKNFFIFFYRQRNVSVRTICHSELGLGVILMRSITMMLAPLWVKNVENVQKNCPYRHISLAVKNNKKCWFTLFSSIKALYTLSMFFDFNCD